MRQAKYNIAPGKVRDVANDKHGGAAGLNKVMIIYV